MTREEFKKNKTAIKGRVRKTQNKTNNIRDAKSIVFW